MEQKKIDAISTAVKVFGIVLGVLALAAIGVSIYMQVR